MWGGKEGLGGIEGIWGGMGVKWGGNWGVWGLIWGVCGTWTQKHIRVVSPRCPHNVPHPVPTLMSPH